MLLRFVTGTASVGWMMLLGAVIAAEKNLPGGHRLAQPIGLILLGFAAPKTTRRRSMEYYDLGTYNRKITTASDDAQLWFDRGPNWLYGYNHEAAIQCFCEALKADPECAMAQ
jgi:hypothetical protein